MDLQTPSASSILARRGVERPLLKRNQSSFSSAVLRVEHNENVDITKALKIVSLDVDQKELIKKDLKLVDQLRTEQIPATLNAEKIPRLSTPNKYEAWECGFGTPMPAYTPSSIPSRPEDFLEAVRGELKIIASVRAGLVRYVEVISSGEHQVFTDGFLESQSKATSITMSQLDQIKGHLDEIVLEIEKKLENIVNDEESQEDVPVDLQEAFGHVFYKINYALAADKKVEQK